MSLIARIYSAENARAHESIFETKVSILSKSDSSGEDQGSVLSALTDFKKSGSSWVCIMVAIFNNMAGIGIINIFAT